jgi:manganese/zinc-transporting P-type ATPase C
MRSLFLAGISCRVRQWHPVRTRIQCPVLRGQAGLCAVIERELLTLPQVARAEVRPGTGSVIIIHPDRRVPLATLDRLLAACLPAGGLTASGPISRSAGPGSSPPPGSACRCGRGGESRAATHVGGATLILSGIYLLWLFLRRLVIASPVPASLAARVFSLPALVAVGLSLPIQGQALDNLRRHRRPDMGLISTGLLYLSILTGNVLAALTIFWLFNLAGWLESRIAARTRQAVREMLDGRAESAWLVRDGVEIQVAVTDLEAGDLITLRQGAVIPVDGTVVAGTALVNEATLTGEALPVQRGEGEALLAGTVIAAGEVRLRVDRAGEATRLAAIIRLIESAEQQPGPVQLGSERFSQILVPVSLTLAGTALLLTGSLLQAMTVLIITCPCALRLSTSVAISRAMSLAAGQGILIKGGRYLEIAGRVDVVVLDKTGTLTTNTAEVVEVVPLDRRHKTDRMLQLAASVQQVWPHPLSRAVAGLAAERGLDLLPCADNRLHIGLGVRATIDGQEILVGSRRFMAEEGAAWPAGRQTTPAEAESGSGHLYVARQGRVIGRITTRDTPRGDVARGVARLRALGVKQVVLLTGDSEAAGLDARESGFDLLLCNQSPEEKAAWISAWKKAHPTDLVAMVGDGINDTPAFAAADLSLAIGDGGADVTVEYADIVLQRGGIDQAATTLALGREALAVIRQSYALAIGLNGATLALTTLGMLPPVAGALIHNLITVTAVAHAASLHLAPGESVSGKSPEPAAAGAGQKTDVASAGENVRFI